MNEKKLMKVLSYLMTVLITAFCVSIFVESRVEKELAKPPVPTNKLTQLYQLIQQNFADDVDTKAMGDAGAEAMVNSLGNRWSYYIPAEEYAAHVEAAKNEYVGVGITIHEDEEHKELEIIDVVPGSSADQAGIQVKDILLEVEGKSCAELGRSGTAELVRGKEGTKVTLVVSRDGEKKEFTLKRMKVDVPVVNYQILDSGYGLVTIKNFQNKAFKETNEAVEALLKQNAKGIIFDVRFNPGGAKSELVSILDYLLPEGEVFRSETHDVRITVDESDEDCVKIPMAVLVNGDSYSAAEYFAAALQEYEWAVVVGEKTTGKGYYQQTFKLNDGSGVNLSTGKYYTPSGLHLEGIGITPDVPVELNEEMKGNLLAGLLSPEQDPQIQAAISALDSRNHLD